MTSARAMDHSPVPASESQIAAAECAANAHLLGRDVERNRLRAAIRNRESLLIWGPQDAGKTFLVKAILSELPENDRKRCIYWSGAASVRQLAEGLARGLYEAGDPIVRRKVREGGGGSEISLRRWLREQTSGHFKAMLYAAAARSRYVFFLDHMAPATPAMTRLWKEIIWRSKTPVFLLARGCDHDAIGSAWSIYFSKEYRVEIRAFPEQLAREWVERCIARFGLERFDLTGFREEVLRLSRHLPGSVEKMCALAAQQRYHYGEQIKIKLVHVDYLMQSEMPGARLPGRSAT
ncbi:MAG: AAA family ATPase [Bryobacteraceae bacterium]